MRHRKVKFVTSYPVLPYSIRRLKHVQIDCSNTLFTWSRTEEAKDKSQSWRPCQNGGWKWAGYETIYILDKNRGQIATETAIL